MHFRDLNHHVDAITANADVDEGTIYQPLRSGRIWHKVNF